MKKRKKSNDNKNYINYVKAVKCPIKYILNGKINNIITNAIYDTHIIVSNTYNFIRSYVLWCYDNDKKIDNFNEQLIIYIMKLVSNRKTKKGRQNDNSYKQLTNYFNDYFNKILLEDYKAYDDKLSHILHYEAIDIVKNIEVNIKEHFIQQLFKFINVYFKLDDKLEKINKITDNDEKKE